jgi:hypothetical protein
LRFTPSTTIVGDDNIVLPAPVLVTLDTDGSFTVDLVGTDDADYAPSGWVWTVEERMTGGRAPWSFELTADSDLSDLTAVVPSGTYTTYLEAGDDATLLGSGAALDNLVLTSDGAGGTVWEAPGAIAGAVDSVNGETGVVVLDATDVGAAPTAHTHAPGDVTGTAVITSDARLSDARTPTSHAHTLSDVWDAGGAAALDVGTTAGTVAAGDDARIEAAIPDTLVDAKGDLIVGTAADTVARLPVGATTGHVLTVDPGEAAGVKWAAAGGGAGGMTLIARTVMPGGSSVLEWTSIPQTFDALLIVFNGKLANGGAAFITAQFNGDTGANYDDQRHTAYNGGTVQTVESAAATSGIVFIISGVLDGSAHVGQALIPNYTGTAFDKATTGTFGGWTADASAYVGNVTMKWNNTAAINAIKLLAGTNIASGTTFSLYGIGSNA